jgi:hypothetical protein
VARPEFTFFGAPVGMIFTMDRRLGLGQLIDIGMFLEALNANQGHGGLVTERDEPLPY